MKGMKQHERTRWTFDSFWRLFLALGALFSGSICSCTTRQSCNAEWERAAIARGAGYYVHAGEGPGETKFKWAPPKEPDVNRD